MKINSLWKLVVCLMAVQVVFAGKVKRTKLLREPYLQSVWADSVKVMFKTDIAIKKAVVKFGEKLDEQKQKVATNSYEHFENIIHEATIKNLKPNTKYYYSVEIKGKEVIKGESYYFISAPKENKSFSFYAMGDIGAEMGNKEGRYSELSAKQINNLTKRPDFGLGLGDIVYPKGESAVYDSNLFQPLADVFKNIPFYPCLGNHDWMVDPDLNFAKEFSLPGNEHYYGFEYLNAYFIALDSRDGNFYEVEKQTAWLENELAKIKGKYDWIFVYLHHNGNTCTYKEDYAHVIKLYKVFANGGVDFVLNGHAHTYERLKPFDQNGNVIESVTNHEHYTAFQNGFIAITTGAGGKIAKWTPNPNDKKKCPDSNILAKVGHYPHFSVFEIDGKKLKMKAISSLDGAVFDEFTMEK